MGATPTMLVGIVIMLVASASFNGAPIVLRLVTRTLPNHAGATLLHAVLTRRAGLAGLALSLLGWSLQVVALLFIPLTLGRILFAAGLGLMLVLAHRTLHEPIGRRDVLGVLLVIGGMAAAATAPPARTTTSPSPLQWLLLSVLLGVPVLLPVVLRLVRRSGGMLLSAGAAGAAYALASLYNKGLANVLPHRQMLPVLLLLVAAAASALLGFVSELEALRDSHAARVAPLYRMLQTVIPIACAPLFFGERWPTDPLGLILLAGGITLTVLGILMISWPRREEEAPKAAPTPASQRETLAPAPAPRPRRGAAATPAWPAWRSFLRQHRACVVVELLILGLALALDVVAILHPAPLPGDVGGVLAVQHLLAPHKTLTLWLEQVSTITWPIPALETIIAAVALLLLLRRWLDALLVALFTALGSGSSYLTAELIQRPRPAGHGIAVLFAIKDYWSFPSGHVEHALTFFGLLLFLTYRMGRPAPTLRPVLWIVRLGLFALIVLMAPSRLVEGQHWTSDVVAGYLYGAFWLILGLHVYDWAALRWPRLLARDERTRVAYAA